MAAQQPTSIVRFQVKAVGGGTPQLEKAKLRTEGSNTWSSVEEGLRRIFTQLAAQGHVAWTPSDPIHTYIAGFVPLPEQRMGDLFDCFGTDGELVVQYSTGEPAHG